LCATSGVTTLLVTHDINEAAFMGNRVIVMATRPGRVAGIVGIDVPTPRPAGFRKDDAFLESTTAIRDLLERA
jgi:ABC-type nitrate/sulfonate/bicarbonate transport system ATPase subunit